MSEHYFVYKIEHTERMCSLMHSTNPLPPIPSASDSIKAENIKQIHSDIRLCQQEQRYNQYSSKRIVTKFIWLRQKRPTKDGSMLK